MCDRLYINGIWYEKGTFWSRKGMRCFLSEDERCDYLSLVNIEAVRQLVPHKISMAGIESLSDVGVYIGAGKRFVKPGC